MFDIPDVRSTVKVDSQYVAVGFRQRGISIQKRGSDLKSFTSPPGNWALVNEIGIEADSNPVTDSQLCFPSFAAKAADGSCLIVDELGTEKIVPFRFESRTLRVNNQGVIDQKLPLTGIDDGFACLLDQNCTAILRRTKWELMIVSDLGVVKNRMPLSSFSKRMPRYVSWTDQATFLIVFCNRVGEVDIIEIDQRGELLWFLSPHAGQIGLAASVQWLVNDTFLIADPYRHVVVEIDRGGNTVWQFGQAGEPSQARSRLSSPSSARAMPDGRRLIADARNHRVLLVSQDGTANQLDPEDGSFCDPLFADVLDNGNFLICDTGNQRVVETDPTGGIVWQFGNNFPQRRTLSYPRSVEVTKNGQYLVADTAHDRIVEFEAGQVRERPVQAKPPVFWPRCARALPSGGILIADGRNGRILEIAAAGHVLRELSEIALDGRMALRDPHDVRMLPNGHLLIVDSSRDLVVEADWSGKVYRAIGAGGDLRLSDPHSAQLLSDGRVVIADTGQHRILIVAPDETSVSEFYAIDSDTACFRLNFPRYVEVNENGTMIVADTGNNRVLGATIDGRFIWEFSIVPGTRLSRLNQPRWAQLIGDCELVICDHIHHRILHVKLDEVPGAEAQVSDSNW